MKQISGWFFDLSKADSEQNKKRGLKITARGKPEMTSNTAMIKQSIQMLLSTTQGERVMRPEYGCKLSELVFAKNDDTTAGLAIYYVNQALEQWEPRIEVLEVDAMPNEHDPALLEILINYRIKTSYQEDQLSYSHNLEGEV